MAQRKTTPKAKPKTSAAKKVAPVDRVAVLETHVGETLTIRSNPTEEAVRSFVSEHNRRYHEREQGGPSGIPALHVIRAEWYPEEEIEYDPANSLGEIDISDLL